jgi:hypothetical protein
VRGAELTQQTKSSKALRKILRIVKNPRNTRENHENPWSEAGGLEEVLDVLHPIQES